MSEENKALVRSYFAAINKDHQDAVEQYVADEQLKQHTHLIQEGACPNYQLAIEDMAAEGDQVAVRFTVLPENQAVSRS